MRALLGQAAGELRTEIHEGDDWTRRELLAVSQHIVTTLRAEIRQGDEDTRRLLRALHAEVMAHLAKLG
jgi:hypothetical protein